MKKKDFKTIIKKVEINYPKKNQLFWDLVIKYRRNSTYDFYNYCLNLLNSKNYKKRGVGATLLCQINIDGKIRPYHKEVYSLFYNSLKNETNDFVVESILYGIGHNSESLYKKDEINYISSYMNHNNALIRKATISALLTINDPKVVECFSYLANDTCAKVREWATFGLQIKENYMDNEITNILVNKLNDQSIYVRLEAIEGLSLRMHKSAIKAIKVELNSFCIHDKLFNAISLWPKNTFDKKIKSQLKILIKINKTYSSYLKGVNNTKDD